MLSWLGFGALPLARSEPEMNEMLRRICRRNFCTCSHRPWLFVGLGNPGDKYRGTRHNVGFEMLDAFADSQGIHMETVHCKAMFGKGLVNGIPVLVAKPLTYMNLSGESIGPLAAYYKLPLNRVVVFHDDMDLPCGVLRLHPKGGHNRHNGLKSVIYHFRGNGEFPRLRIGIGRPPGQMDPKAFMLQKFNLTARERISVPRGYYKSYRKLDFSGYKHKDSCKFTKINISAGKNLYAKTIDAALLEGAHALEQVVSKGFSESSNCFNTMQKYKHIRLQTLPA